jgi:hypothetical protein
MNPISDKNWRVGTSLIAGLLLVVALDRASGQPAPAEGPSNVECLERLEIPDYPPLARQANIQVTQIVKVLLSDQATAQNIQYSSQGNPVKFERLFKEGTEKALTNSRFSKTCGGKTITLVFHYEIRDDPDKLQLFAFRPPNHFWIRAAPFYVTPEVTAK